MKTLVAVLILAAASLSAAEPPNPLHDLPIAAPVPRPVTDVSSPTVASDGEGFFAAWGDFRAQNLDVYGARFSASGEPLDPEGRVVHATYENDDNPFAVWNGADYVTFSSSGFLGGWNTLVSNDGEVRGAGGERLPQSAVPNAAAFNGSTYAQPLATYRTSGFLLELVLRGRDFNIRHRVTLADVSGIGGIFLARVATDGQRFLAVWERHVEFDRIVEAAIVEEDGTFAVPPFELAHAAATQPGWATFAPDVAWNGTSYLVVMSAPDGIRALPIAAGGTRGDSKLVAAGTSINPVIAWDGHAHLVLWNVVRNFSLIATRGAIVTATGDPVETFELSDRQAFHRPAVASNGEVFFAIAAGESYVLRSTGPERIVRRGGAVTRAYRQQANPSIAAGATNFLTAWIENQQALWIGRLSRRGEALDGGGILLQQAAVTGVKVYAARGFYVVAWQNSPGEVRIARVTEGGEIVDPEGIVLSPSGTPAVVATNGAETRVVWGRRNPVAQSPPIELVSATLPERGPVGEPKLLVGPGEASRGIRLFPNGDRFTLLYEFIVPPACPQPRFCAVEFEYRSLTIDAAGNPSPPLVLARGLFFDAAADERSIVMSWYEGFSYRTRRLGLDGVPADAAVELPGTPSPTNFPHLARTAFGFVLLLNEPAIRAIHLDRDGRPVTSPAVLLQTASPIVGDATYAGGQTWIAYTSVWRPLPNAHAGGIARAWVHVLGPRRRATR